MPWWSLWHGSPCSSQSISSLGLLTGDAKSNGQKPHLKWWGGPVRAVVTLHVDRGAPQEELYQNSPNFLFSVKEFPRRCFSGLVCGSPLDSMPRVVIPCCSYINPFCRRNSWLFKFSREHRVGEDLTRPSADSPPPRASRRKP